MSRIRRSLRLIRCSWEVLIKDKELLICPLLSSAAAATLIIPYVLFIIGYSAGHLQALPESTPSGAAMTVVPGAGLFVGTFFFYLLCHFVITYFNSVIVACALVRLRGGDPSLKDGFRQATARIVPIFMWSVISATVGILLKSLQRKADEERNGLLALAGSLAGVGWALTSYFVIPIILAGNQGVFAAIGASKELLKKTWAEQVSGNIGFGFLFFVLAAGMIASSVTLIFLVPSVGAWWLVLIVPMLVFLFIVQSTMEMIFQAALYLFASEGRAPEGFGEDLLKLTPSR